MSEVSGISLDIAVRMAFAVGLVVGVVLTLLVMLMSSVANDRRVYTEYRQAQNEDEMR